jgi:hydrogenase-4 component E
VTGTLYVQLLDLAAGVFLLCAVWVLWRRELAAIVWLLAAQGVALATLAALQAVHQGSGELFAVAAGVGVLKAGVLPAVLRRVLAASGVAREAEPRVNVTASLLVAAALSLLAYAVSRPLVELAPSPATHAVPVGLAAVFIGFFVLVTRLRALSQVVGFLMLDNGIAATAFLITSGVPLVVELAVSLDVLLAVLVLQVLASRMQATFGGADLDELRELRD